MEMVKIFKGVKIGEGTNVGQFSVLGHPWGDSKEGENPLLIGRDGNIRSHTVIYASTTIGDRFQTGHHAIIREKTRIGDNCSVGSGSRVEFAVVIGNGVRIHSNSFIPEYCIIEDDAWIGPNVVLTNAKYPCAPGVKDNLAGVHVGRAAKIGANATVLPGLHIGEGALVGAGSVVVKDVEPGAVVAGNPAKQINHVDNLPYGKLPL